jgi:hypothetical protein
MVGPVRGEQTREVGYRVTFRINHVFSIERASACQARACIGAEGFIHSEESVTKSSARVAARRTVCPRLVRGCCMHYKT